MADEYIITQEDLNQGSRYLQTFTREHPVCRIADSVTSIGDYAFKSCYYLASIAIPDSVTSIGNHAFTECTGLTSMNIPDSVTSIGPFAFYNCRGLKSITLPDSVTSIGGQAFAECVSLESITIPNGVTTISENTFSGCSLLTSVTIPNSVTSIGDNAFYNCSNLQTINVSPDFDQTVLEGKGIPSSAQIVVVEPQSEPDPKPDPEYNQKDEYIITQEDLNQGHDYLETLTVNHPVCRIADGVTSIGDYAFNNCDSLTSITIPDSVTIIGYRAFNGCSSLTSMDIPDSVTSIDEGAFDSCSSLTSITIGDSVTFIGDYAFHNCSNLTSITIPDSVTSFDRHTFWGCTGLQSITIGDGVTEISEDAFSGCFGLTSVTIGNSVTSIGREAFCNCSCLTSITIPDSVTSIGNHAFSDCSSLTDITIPDSVTEIGEGAFSDCSNLTTINVGPNFDQTLLENAGIPSTAQIVVAGSEPNPNPEPEPEYNQEDEYIITQEDLDQGNSYLQTLTTEHPVCRIADGVTSIPDRAFRFCVNLTSIEIPNGVTSIGDSAFDTCESLTSINIPDSVTSIGGRAFAGCFGLTSINIPDSVTSIGDSAFHSCRNLTSIEIPDSVTSIGGRAFLGCHSLTSINIPDSVTSIGEGAFAYCSGLTSINIPDSVTSISDGTFTGCSSIESIVIPNGVTTIGEYAFGDCSSLTSITIPDSVISIGEGTFDECSNLTTINVGPNFDQTLLEEAGLPDTAQIIVVEPDPEYNQLDERLLVKGNERITRDLKVQGNIFGDDYHTAFLPNLKSDSIELGDGVVRKIAKNAESGVVSYDATNAKFVTSDDLTLPGDLVVDGQITARKDLSISGDLYVNGTEHINDVETIQSSDDYFVLRHNKSTALGANEHAGIAVHNYALDKTATLTTDNQGIWRVADNSETSTTYTGVSYYNGDYFTGLTQTATTVIDGIKTAYDQDELDECAYYNDAYYHFDGISWYGISLVSGVITVGPQITDTDVITALEALTRNDLVYYRSLTVTVINEVQNQPLLTRAEEADLNNGDILAWDGTNKKAVHLPRPALSNQALKSKITNGVVSYEWGNSGSAGVAFVGTRAQYDVARLIPEGQDGFIPPNSIVKITDEDDYVTGENR